MRINDAHQLVHGPPLVARTSPGGSLGARRYSHSLDATTTVLDGMRRFPPSVEFVLDGLIRRSNDPRAVGGRRCNSVYRHANNLGLAQKGNPALEARFLK